MNTAIPDHMGTAIPYYEKYHCNNKFTCNALLGYAFDRGAWCSCGCPDCANARRRFPGLIPTRVERKILDRLKEIRDNSGVV